jgi:hypothetical protein
MASQRSSNSLPYFAIINGPFNYKHLYKQDNTFTSFVISFAVKYSELTKFYLVYKVYTRLITMMINSWVLVIIYFPAKNRESIPKLSM